ncbi:MAG: SDR family NAD(P)-dependent oxidoreductase [Burkholderiales bacterium]
MNLQLDGLHAIVTGGSSGIGAAVVRALAAEGCRVSFCARGQEQIDKTLLALADLPGKVEATSKDVTERENFAKWMRV